MLRRRQVGFTLMEVLVVVGIIAVLAAIMFPTFFAARERARLTVCTSNLRQLGLAIQMYMQDWEWEPFWLSGLVPAYLSREGILFCPDDRSHPKGSDLDRQGRFTEYRDPYLRCSYLYEFNPLIFPLDKFGPDFPNQPPGLTWRQVKYWDLRIYGEKTPLVRCWWHTDVMGSGEQVLNLAHDGHVYRHPQSQSWTTQ